MAENPIIEWLTDSNTFFLLGAGCSKCAGKPLIRDLSAKVLEKAGKLAAELYGNLVGTGGRGPTVEDLLTQLLQIKSLLSSRKVQKEGDWSIESVDQAINSVTKGIVEEIGGVWTSSSTHERLFQRLAGHTGRTTCDIFTLNYDVIIESTLEELQLPYTDGFRGAENAYFDPIVYDEESRRAPFFRLYKLHGSVNWYRDDRGAVRRRPSQGEIGGGPHLIYPSEQKYRQTQYGVYESLLSRFRDRLRQQRPNNKLVILGYSLSDDHIAEAIVDSVCVPGGNLTVYAFLGADENPALQTARLQSFADRCHNRFNVMIGRHHFIGSALEPNEWNAIKENDLWKFENLVRMMTGEVP